ncbi:MAG TPA: ABC transporter permease, partial [Candidatus Hydrogenedentes bacterium]|nr:ABC transporter permease [Candidatus Hydrogenedentota bacterium]
MSDSRRLENFVPPVAVEQGASLWRDALVRLRKNRLATAGLVVLCALVLVSLLTPWIAPYGYEEQDLALGAVPPNRAHWFGTDLLGRDLFTRVLYGGRISLLVGFAATGVSLC